MRDGYIKVNDHWEVWHLGNMITTAKSEPEAEDAYMNARQKTIDRIARIQKKVASRGE